MNGESTKNENERFLRGLKEQITNGMELAYEDKESNARFWVNPNSPVADSLRRLAMELSTKSSREKDHDIEEDDFPDFDKDPELFHNSEAANDPLD